MNHKSNVLCKKCGKEFLKNNADIKRSPNNYCSKQCAYISFRSKDSDFKNKLKVTESGCHEWTGSINRCGYGALRRGASPSLAHRVSYELNFGEFDKALHVLHKCDNRSCCNPDHLFLGTHEDNMKDMSIKGRGRKKLTVENVHEIRSSSLSSELLAMKFNVCSRSIRYARQKSSWPHLPELPSAPNGEE